MRHTAVISMAALAAVLSQPSLADVRVTFVNSYRYGEFQDKGEDKLETALAEIRHTLEDLGAYYLSTHEVLKVQVLDIGPVKLNVPGASVSPSQMELQYVLQRDGQIVERDHETISDINNLENPAVPKAKDALVYEKAMLQDWFMAHFGAGKLPPLPTKRTE